MSLNNPVI